MTRAVFDPSVLDGALFGGSAELFDGAVFDFGVFDEALEYPRLYYVVGPTAGWSEPTGAEIVAGRLAGGALPLAAGNQLYPAAPAQGLVFDDPIPGLSYAIAQSAAVVWFNGADYSNVASGPIVTVGGKTLILFGGQMVSKVAEAGDARVVLAPDGSVLATVTPSPGQRELSIDDGRLIATMV